MPADTAGTIRTVVAEVVAVREAAVAVVAILIIAAAEGEEAGEEVEAEVEAEVEEGVGAVMGITDRSTIWAITAEEVGVEGHMDKGTHFRTYSLRMMMVRTRFRVRVRVRARSTGCIMLPFRRWVGWRLGMGM